MHRVSYLQAINEALIEEMERDDRVFVMGEDVGWNLMGATGGLTEKFGKERVRNTPISEAGFVGAAAGAAMVGMRPVVDMLIAPFVYVAFDQFVSIIAKSTYLYGGQARLPLTVRAPMLYGSGNAAQHSDRPYATFMSIPGLKLIAPATPYDAKGMLKAAIRDDDPVISFEDGTVWGLRSEVPEDDLVIPLGQADIKRSGTDVTIVAVAGAVRTPLMRPSNWRLIRCRPRSSTFVRSFPWIGPPFSPQSPRRAGWSWPTRPTKWARSRRRSPPWWPGKVLTPCGDRFCG